MLARSGLLGFSQKGCAPTTALAARHTLSRWIRSAQEPERSRSDGGFAQALASKTRPETIHGDARRLKCCSRFGWNAYDGNCVQVIAFVYFLLVTNSQKHAQKQRKYENGVVSTRQPLPLFRDTWSVLVSIGSAGNLASHLKFLLKSNADITSSVHYNVAERIYRKLTENCTPAPAQGFRRVGTILPYFAFFCS